MLRPGSAHPLGRIGERDVSYYSYKNPRYKAQRTQEPNHHSKCAQSDKHRQGGDHDRHVDELTEKEPILEPHVQQLFFPFNIALFAARRMRALFLPSIT